MSDRTPRFPTNWHLGAARSIAVLRYMIDAGDIDPSRIAASGYSRQTPRPERLAENRALNRGGVRLQAGPRRRSRDPSAASRPRAEARADTGRVPRSGGSLARATRRARECGGAYASALLASCFQAPRGVRMRVRTWNRFIPAAKLHE